MKDIKFANYHPQDQIIGDWTKGVKTISSFKDLASYTLLSEIKPKTLDEAVTDDDWNIAMEEELH